MGCLLALSQMPVGVSTIHIRGRWPHPGWPRGGVPNPLPHPPGPLGSYDQPGVLVSPASADHGGCRDAACPRCTQTAVRYGRYRLTAVDHLGALNSSTVLNQRDSLRPAQALNIEPERTTSVCFRRSMPRDEHRLPPPQGTDLLRRSHEFQIYSPQRVLP
jgi:hypothetical protein